MSIKAFDLRPLELQIIPEAARAICYGQICSPAVVVHVSREDALLISWGELPNWRAYLTSYRGNCIIIIADQHDQKCQPSIAQVRQFLPLANWLSLVSDYRFPNRFGSYTFPEVCLVAVFQRICSETAAPLSRPSS
jgi:hypothetical protein